MLLRLTMCRKKITDQFSMCRKILLGFFFLTSSVVMADSSYRTPSSAIFSVFLSLVVVIGVIFFCAWMVKRINGFQVKHVGHIQLISSLMLGTKQKLIIVQVGKKQVLLGVTANNISSLMELDEVIAQEDMNKKEPLFKQILLKQNNPISHE